MRREGRPHGMVMTQVIEQDTVRKSRGNRFSTINAPPTAGVFTKVPSKPTNHSKPGGGMKENKMKGSKGCSKRFGSSCDILFNPNYALPNSKYADLHHDDDDAYEDCSEEDC